MKIAFLLGAGASNQFGIPTTEEMAGDFLTMLGEPDLHYFLDEKDVKDIEKLIKTFHQIKELQYNLGLYLSDISDEQLNNIVELSERYDEIENRIFNFIREKCRSQDISNAIQIYQQIINLKKRTELQIFTTNYDVIFEEVCRQLKIKYNDGFRQEEHGYNKVFDPQNFGGVDVQLYKLHGSINWWSDDKRQKVFCLDPSLQGIEGFQNLMIYPAEKEDYFQYPFNILQWLFNIVLNQTDELIVIGHKFGDKNILAPVSAALERPNFELTLVNPSARIIKEEIFQNHDRVNVIEKTFEQWVNDGGIKDLENKLPIPESKPTKKAKLTKDMLITTSYSDDNMIPYARHIPEAKGVLFDVLDSMKNRYRCPNCQTTFSVNMIYRNFSCPYCNIKLEPKK